MHDEPVRRTRDGRIASALRCGERGLAALLLLSFATVLAGGAAAQEVQFSSGTYRVSEGDVLTPELVLSHARSEDVTVRVEALDLGEAKSGEDFAADPWHVTVPAGQTRRSFDIATFHDDKVERDEQFLLHVAPWGHSPGLRRSSNGNGDAVAYINDDDTLVSLLRSTYIVWEGGTATIRVTIPNPRPTAFTLDYTLSALSGDTASDADVVDGFGTRSITVPANARGVDIHIRTAQDNVSDEGTESFSVRLSTSESGVVFGRNGVANVWIMDDGWHPEVTFASASSSVDEGAGTHQVTVNWSPPTPGNSVLWLYTWRNCEGRRACSNRVATLRADYAVFTGTALSWNIRRVVVPAGTRTLTIPVTIIDDGDAEGDEVFWMGLVAYHLHDRFGQRRIRRVTPNWQHKVTIVDDDVGDDPRVSFASASQSVAEGSGAHDVEVRLNKAPTSDLTVSYTVGGTATPGADFTITNSGTVTVPAGAKTATIPVTIVDDGVDDGDETVVLTLAAGGDYGVGRADTHTLYIDPVPAVAFPFPLGTIYESGGTYRVPVHLSPAPSSALALTYTVEGTALPGVDYKPLSGTVTAPAGATTVHIPVTIIDDIVEDNGEIVRLTLADGSGYAVGSEYGTFDLFIFNHEAGSTEGRVQARLDVAVASGDGASANLWRRALAAVRGETPPDGLEPLTGAEAEGLAIDSAERSDFELASLWSEIARVIGDGATNPPPPEPAVTVAAGASPVTEGGDAAFTLTADPAPAADLPVTVTVAADGDYGIAAGERTVTIPASGSATLTLPTTGDDTDEPHGSVSVTVTDGDGYTVGSSASGTVAVQDDDEPAVTIAAGTSPVTEGAGATFTLTADPAPAADLPVTVTVAADGDWGVAAGSRTVTIPTTGSATLTLATTGDNADEPHGSVTVTVTDGDGYTVGSAASDSVAIQDDDAPALAEPAVTVAADTSPVTEGGDATFTLTASPVPATDLPVTVTVAADGDWGVAAGSRTVTIPTTGSATLTLATTGDDADEPHGSVTVTVTDGDGYTVGSSASGTVTIRDDDDPASAVATVDPALVAEVRAMAEQTHHGQAHVNRWRRVLVAFGVETYPGLTPTTAAEAEANAQRYSSPLWPQIATVLAKLEAASEPDTPPVTLPAVRIAAGAAVTEGGDAVFTVTATPAPAADLPVTVAVATDGDYGISAGSRTVTIPTSGSYTLTLATTGDATDEPDGSVTATVQTGTGYTVGAPASDTVALRDDDLPLPEVTVSTGSAVTEGGSATFTLTADPAPASSLSVSVTVATAGDYGVTAGAQTVSIPTTGSAVLTLPTTDDATDEPDGSVSVTVEAGNGYTVGTPASSTVAVRDDDLPPPVVTIAAKAASVAEGGDAVFTLTADRAPAAALTVKLAVSETGEGDHVAASDEGPATLVIAKGATEAVFSVATVNDDADEPDGSASVTVQPGEGYTVGAPASASVEVTDDDAPSAAPALSVGDSTAKEGARFPVMPFTVRLSSPAPGPVRVHVSTRPSTPVSARPGQDYAPGSYDLTFRVGETEKQVWIRIYDDSHDEGAETFEVVLSEAKGAAIGDGVAVGTIVNDDPMPAAWLARFGRTVAEQALDGIAHRMAAPRAPGMRGTLAGRALDFDAPAGGAPGAWSGAGPGAGDAAGGAPTLAGTDALALTDIAQAFSSHSGHSGHGGIDNGFGHDIASSGLRAGGTGPGHDAAGFGNGFGETHSHSETHAQALTAREALLGSSFTLTGERDGAGGTAAFWGRASQGRFDGREGTFSLDGEATTALLGADYARGRWLIGLALARSEGEGDYRDTKGTPRPPLQSCPAADDEAMPEWCDRAVRAGDGRVEASLTAALPYASVQASERWKLWGAAGVGAGEVTLKTAMGGRYRADTTWRMAAAGVRGALLGASPEGAGPALAVTSDALWTRTSSEKTRDLAASDSDVTRLRLGLEGSWRFALDGAGHSETEGAGLRAGGASLTPKLEVGARHDGGDAETGFGVELGGGLAWSDPALGLSLDVSGRTLLAHEDDDLKDRGYAASLGFDPSPASERGPSLILRQELGARATGGLDALFAPEPLEDRTGSEAASRWSMEAAYGVPAFGGRFTGSPHVGLGLSAATKDYTLGWRWTPARGAPDLVFGLKATRRESDAAAPEHTLGVEVRATW